MNFRFLLSSYLFMAVAVAQSDTATATVSSYSTSTGTGTSATATGTSLPDLVRELPDCALSCLSSAAKTIGCNASDLPCLCSKSDSLISAIGPCILLSSGCTSDEQSKISSLAASICSDVNNSPDSTEIASASDLITAELGSASASASATASASASGTEATTVNENAAAQADCPLASMGLMGAAAVLAALTF